jgi:hypothetical protein
MKSITKPSARARTKKGMRMAATIVPLIKERSIGDGVSLMVAVGPAVPVGPVVLVGLAAGLASRSSVIGSLSKFGR